jgi:hypothetical protein
LIRLPTMKSISTLLLLFLGYCLVAQSNTNEQIGAQESRVAKATEFSIPTSAAFNMLNENTPNRIERYASLHDFKVDWSLTNGQQGYTLSPGLAIEAQPVWLLFFDRAGAAKYRSATPLTRTLSTLSVSVGTTATTEKNWLAWAAKLNLYRQNDPLNDPAFLKTLDESTEDSKDSFFLEIKALEVKQIRLNRRDPSFEEQYSALSDSIAQLEFGIQDLERAQSQKLSEVRENYIQKHWNSSFLDVAFGRLSVYKQTQKTIIKTFEDPNIPGQIDTTSFNNNTLEISKQGYGVWMTGGLGIGRNAMISGMVRYAQKPSRLTGTIGQVISMGANIRYGTRRYNFFIEGFYDRSLDPVAEGSDTKLEQKFYMLTIGGDWRISRNVVLCFGIRQTKDFDNGTYLMQPLVNVNCLMR